MAASPTCDTWGQVPASWASGCLIPIHSACAWRVDTEKQAIGSGQGCPAQRETLAEASATVKRPRSNSSDSVGASHR